MSKMKQIGRFGLVLWLGAGWLWPALGAPIRLEHKPVSWSIRGQPLTLRAQVSGGEGGIESVTLFYALFRDAAPFRVPMTASGMNVFIGTIEAGLLSGVSSISYYIEAQDREGTVEETAWYEVTFRDPEAERVAPAAVAPAPAARPAPVARPTPAQTPPPATTPAPVVQPSRPAMTTPTPVVPPSQAAAPSTPSRSTTSDEGISAATLGIIAGGAVAVAAGAYFISESGGSSGGGGGDPTPPPPETAGRYSGVATVCLTLGDGPTECESSNATVIIDVNGRVLSDNLRPGQQLTGSLSGNDFTLVANVDSGGVRGTIFYNGTVFGNRVIGSVSGTATSGDGETTGSYSGSFTLNRQ
ncbi:MAG TPA: hypothetical protein PKE55_10490 [Kiritimatiellia bacterium]|nr:hypothetical protein [Kiritimatiellia bacterium]